MNRCLEPLFFQPDVPAVRRHLKGLQSSPDPRAAWVGPVPEADGDAEAATIAPPNDQGRRLAGTIAASLIPCDRLFPWPAVAAAMAPTAGKGTGEGDGGGPGFTIRLLGVLDLPILRGGVWRLMEPYSAWPENPTAEGFLAYAWEGPLGSRLLVVVNGGPTRGQAYVPLPFTDLGRGTLRLTDILGEARYERNGRDLMARGLYVDMAPFAFHAFSLSESG